SWRTSVVPFRHFTPKGRRKPLNVPAHHDACADSDSPPVPVPVPVPGWGQASEGKEERARWIPTRRARARARVDAGAARLYSAGRDFSPPTTLRASAMSLPRNLPRISVFPKCYFDDLYRGDMDYLHWLREAATLGAEGVEHYDGFFKSLDAAG